MSKPRKIELLAPAKNLESGKEAILHGADAVYIGAPKFSARAAAGNSMADIEELVKFAHLYNVRIYVALNTLLSDEELAETEAMIHDLYRIGVDALIVQDMGITRLNLPPIPLHASTQTDNRSVEKVKFLADSGFTQVVLARELSLNEIHQIHEACPKTALEAFVHGALCVSYSGQCYVSQACYGRSANRGMCAQFCRLPFQMVDADGKTIARNKHLLSLKDLNLNDDIEALLDAGVSSLKIEGRLKDLTYVKNVTAAYRQKIDAVLKRRKEFVRASSGTSTYTFAPQLDKTFSRGFTKYYLNGRGANEVASFDTPKSLGEEMGYTKEQRGNFIIVAGVKPFHNGDGACYIDKQGQLKGFRVNRVDGNKIYPLEPQQIPPRTTIYRNFDQDFERLLSRKSAERKLHVSIQLAETPFGFSLTMTDEDKICYALSWEANKELARTPQTDNLRNQLSKLGNTPFEAGEIEINFSDNWFIPASQLAELRRQVVERLITTRYTAYRQELVVWKPTSHIFPTQHLTYLGNVMNNAAASFYADHGVKQIDKAFEAAPVKDAVLMLSKHCIRYSMGWCPTHHKQRSPYREPYFLISSDGKRFKLKFDCKNCLMEVSKEEEA